jgi:hypothetical protein
MTQKPQPATAVPEAAAARPATLRVAAAVHAVEAAGMVVATIFAAVATISGKSYETSSGVALTALAVIAAAWLAGIALPIARAKPWTRTPAVMNQLFVIIAGVMLVQGHRLDWGVPALILGVAGAAALLTPKSIKAMNRPE